MTGIQLLREVRADGKLKQIPFIMSAAESESEIDAMLIAFGVDVEHERKEQPARIEKNKRAGDEELLAGPKKPGEVISQYDIDKLLAESD